MSQDKPRFIRKNGKIIPIKAKGDKAPKSKKGKSEKEKTKQAGKDNDTLVKARHKVAQPIKTKGVEFGVAVGVGLAAGRGKSVLKGAVKGGVAGLIIGSVMGGLAGNKVNFAKDKNGKVKRNKRGTAQTSTSF